MNFIIWLVVGGIIGWVASMIMKTDAQQGMLLNVVVGIVGAMLGGWLISPLLGAGTVNQGDFSIGGLDRVADWRRSFCWPSSTCSGAAGFARAHGSVATGADAARPWLHLFRTVFPSPLTFAGGVPLSTNAQPAEVPHGKPVRIAVLCDQPRDRFGPRQGAGRRHFGHQPRPFRRRTAADGQHDKDGEHAVGRRVAAQDAAAGHRDIRRLRQPHQPDQQPVQRWPHHRQRHAVVPVRSRSQRDRRGADQGTRLQRDAADRNGRPGIDGPGQQGGADRQARRQWTGRAAEARNHAVQPATRPTRRR